MAEVQEDVVVLQAGFTQVNDDVNDLESENINQDYRINILEAEIFDNENDIEGKKTMH